MNRVVFNVLGQDARNGETWEFHCVSASVIRVEATEYLVCTGILDALDRVCILLRADTARLQSVGHSV